MAHPSVPRRGSLSTGGLDEGGGSVPGPQHPQQHVHQQQQQQQQPSSQSLHMPTKKKSGFQITSVTAAQPNSVAEDTESYDDLDESRTEDISSEILDGSRNADFEPGAYERSSSEETLNNVGEGVDTPALTPVHAQGGVFMVNGGPHLGPANAAAQGHGAAANLTAPPRLAPSPAAASTAAAPPSSQTVAGPAVAAAFSAPAQPGVASPRAAAAVPPATPPPAAQAMAPAPVSVATAPSSQVAPSNPLQQQPHPPHHHHHHHLPVCSSRFRVVKLDTTTEPYKKGRWTCTEYYEKESASLAADASAAAASAAVAAASVAAAAAARNNVNDSMKESGAPTLVAASYNAVDAASGAALARVNSLDYGSQQGGINAVNSGVPAAFNKQQGNTVGHNIQQQQLSNVNAFVQSAGGQGSIQTVGVQQVVSASAQPQPSQQPQQMSYAGQQQMGVQPQGQAMGGSALTQGPLTVAQMPGPAQTGEGKAATMASSQLGGQHPQSTPAVPQPQALGQPAQSIAHQVIHNAAATQQSYIAHQGSVASQVTHQQPQPGQPLGQQTLLGQQQQQQQVMQQPQPIGQQAQQMGQASMQPQLGQQQQQPGGQQAQMGAQAQQKGQQTQMGQQALQVGQQSQQPQQVGQQPPVMMVGQQLAQQLSQHNPPQSPQVVQQNPMMPQQPPQSPSLVQQQQATSQQLFQQQTPHPIAQQAFPQQSMPTHGLSEQQQAINQHNFQQQPLTQQAQPMTPQQAFSQQPPMQAHVLSEQQQQALSQPAFQQQQQQPPMLPDQQSMQQPQASQPVGPPGPVLQPQQQQHAQLAVQPPPQQQQQHGLLPLQQILPVSGLASGAPIGGAAPQPLPVGLQHPLTLGGDLGGYGGSFLPQAAASLLLQHGQQQLSHQQSQALLSLAYSVAQTQHQLPGGHPEDPSGAAAHGEVHGEGFAGGIPVIPQLLPMAVGATQGLLESEEERTPSAVFYQTLSAKLPRHDHRRRSDSASGASVVAIDNKIEQAMDLVKSHLMYAVREEVEVLKEQIKELIEKNSQLEQENRLLKSLASPEQLQQIQSQIVSVPSVGGGAQPSTPGGGTPAVCTVAAPPAAAAPVTTAPSATALPSV
uniref:TSC22 domain family protein 2-like isoform X1 n=2 Tax=Petromyzon marinus TaxID=7757 RepID=A0AAJ7U0S4_PETMA|nr:TSC22 domain family protein 2-like isoform X1 [Petromyzon marinus]